MHSQLEVLSKCKLVLPGLYPDIPTLTAPHDRQLERAIRLDGHGD